MTEIETSTATVSGHHRVEEIHLQVDRAVIENLPLLQDLLHLTATGTVTSPEHHQQVLQVVAINLQPYLLQRVHLALLPRHRHSHVEETQLLQHRLDLEAAVVADLRTIHLATSLVLHHAVDLGEVDLVVEVSTAAVLHLALVAQEVVLRRSRRLSEAQAILLQPPTHAPCASATI